MKCLGDVVKDCWGRLAPTVIAFIDGAFVAWAKQRVPNAIHFPTGISGMLLYLITFFTINAEKKLSSGKDYHCILEHLPYVLYAAHLRWPTDKSEQVVAAYTIYVICKYFNVSCSNILVAYNYNKLHTYTRKTISLCGLWLNRYGVPSSHANLLLLLQVSSFIHGDLHSVR